MSFSLKGKKECLIAHVTRTFRKYKIKKEEETLYEVITVQYIVILTEQDVFFTAYVSQYLLN